MLFTRENGAADSCLCVDLPIVGSKWTGKPQSHLDTQAGTYWEVMPELTASELRVQKALLNKVVDKTKVLTYTESFKLTKVSDESVEQSKTITVTGCRLSPGFAAGTIAATASSD